MAGQQRLLRRARHERVLLTPEQQRGEVDESGPIRRPTVSLPLERVAQAGDVFAPVLSLAQRLPG